MISNIFIRNIIKGDLSTKVFLWILLLLALLVPALNIYVPAGNFFHITDYHISLIVKYLTYGLLALSLDQKNAWVWNNDARSWDKLGDEYVGSITKAVKMGQKVLPFDLVKLPIKAAE